MKWRVLFLCAALFAAPAAAEEAPADPLAPLDFFLGCWRGEFVGMAGMTDERCFSRIVGGPHIRDHHKVVGGPSPYEGESIYSFDHEHDRIVYSYYSGAGGMSRGAVALDGDVLRFDDRHVAASGQVLVFRGAWRRTGPDSFSATTEQEQDGVWREIMRIDFTRAPELTPSQ